MVATASRRCRPRQEADSSVRLILVVQWSYMADMADTPKRNERAQAADTPRLSAGRPEPATLAAGAPGIAPSAVGVVFFGASGLFSRPPLEALLRAGYDVRAVVVSALAGAARQGAPAVTVLPAPPPPTRARARTRRAVPLLAPTPPGSILRIAAEHGIPVLEVARLRDRATLDALAGYRPDAICVACFSRRLPAGVLRLPRLGCINVHPSLLPANRGPDPLFWTFRNGDAQTGATVHLMDAGFDTGPVLRQRALPVPEGCTERELEVACAEAGGELLVQALADLAAGTACPIPQDERMASPHSWPTPDDYIIFADRPARWAYCFAKGLLGRGEPILVRVEGATVRVIAALGYEAQPRLGAPWRLEGDVLSLRCSPGTFTCRVAPVEDAD